MDNNPVIATLGRRLRLAVIGGGPGSFIGGMHRMAARIDDCYELVAGVLSSDPERAIARAKEIGLAEGRGYSSVKKMLETEKLKEDGADVVAIMTPNDSHFEYAMAALDHGFDVICDKPMKVSLLSPPGLVPGKMIRKKAGRLLSWEILELMPITLSGLSAVWR